MCAAKDFEDFFRVFTPYWYADPNVLTPNYKNITWDCTSISCPREVGRFHGERNESVILALPVYPCSGMVVEIEEFD
jgi:hypothetical protein